MSSCSQYLKASSPRGIPESAIHGILVIPTVTRFYTSFLPASISSNGGPSKKSSKAKKVSEDQKVRRKV